MALTVACPLTGKVPGGAWLKLIETELTIIGDTVTLTDLSTWEVAVILTVPPEGTAVGAV
jgi:hypothetical protein